MGYSNRYVCHERPPIHPLDRTADQSGQQVRLINGTDTNFTDPFVFTAHDVSMNSTTSSLTQIRDGQYRSTEH